MSDNTVIQKSRQIPKTTKAPDNKILSNCVETLGLAKIQRHIFLCADQTVPNCCSKQVSVKAWEYLKKRRKQLKCDRPQQSFPICIFRTKANCLRVCCSGPIMVVYPDGVWYRQANRKLLSGSSLNT